MATLPFDYRQVFSAMNRFSVSYLLVGGLNFFLLHKPVTTQDSVFCLLTNSGPVDFFIYSRNP